MVQAQSCPVCEKPLPPGSGESTLFPFCSTRCRQVDLYRWLNGRYAIVEPLDAEQLAREAESGGEFDEDEEL